MCVTLAANKLQQPINRFIQYLCGHVFVRYEWKIFGKFIFNIFCQLKSPSIAHIKLDYSIKFNEIALNIMLNRCS